MTFNNRLNDTIERHVPTDCGCETCKLARFEGSAIRYAVVHNYSYRPRTWKMNKVANDPYDYFLGVELETDNYKLDENGLRVRSRFTNEQAADMRRPKMAWMAKHDGSVSGPEFVSHPGTLAWWHSKRRELGDMFQMLVHAGFRSHDNDKAGMHINISKNAFADNKHLFRFLTLIHTSPVWSLKMSQRTETSARQWASLDYLADDTRRQQEVDRILPEPGVTSWYSGSSQRYQALNCPSGELRFEFRLPRGTLRLDRFFKNLEWTVAMIEYTRTNRAVSNAKPVEFMRWVMKAENRRLYPNLAAYLVERFDNLIIVADDINLPTVVSTSPAPTGEATRRATPVVTTDESGVRISPRTGRPMRAYTRREGANRPGRPTGYSPRRARRGTVEIDLRQFISNFPITNS